MSTDAPSGARSARAGLFGFGSVAALLVLFPCTCLGPFAYMVSAPPIQKAVALIESSPEVAAALGSRVDVSLVVTTDLEPDLIHRAGRDYVCLLTKAEGPRREAWVSLSADNIEEQGWAGRFDVRTIGTQVLVDGAYRAEGDRVILRGTFAPDGSPVVAPPD